MSYEDQPTPCKYYDSYEEPEADGHKNALQLNRILNLLREERKFQKQWSVQPHHHVQSSSLSFDSAQNKASSTPGPAKPQNPPLYSAPAQLSVAPVYSNTPVSTSYNTHFSAQSRMNDAISCSAAIAPSTNNVTLIFGQKYSSENCSIQPSFSSTKISTDFFLSIFHLTTELENTPKRLRLRFGDLLEIPERVEIEITHGNFTAQVPVIIVDNQASDCIIGIDFLRKKIGFEHLEDSETSPIHVSVISTNTNVLVPKLQFAKIEYLETPDFYKTNDLINENIENKLIIVYVEPILEHFPVKAIANEVENVPAVSNAVEDQNSCDPNFSINSDFYDDDMLYHYLSNLAERLYVAVSNHYKPEFNSEPNVETPQVQTDPTKVNKRHIFEKLFKALFDYTSTNFPKSEQCPMHGRCQGAHRRDSLPSPPRDRSWKFKDTKKPHHVLLYCI